MSLASASAFLDVLEKSRLVSPDRLAKLRGRQGEFPDAKSLAVRLVKDSVLTRWQAGALLAGNHRLSVGKYRLLSQLGSGKTGRVFLAQHAEMGRQAALKILPRRADASATNLQQFLDQARAVSALDHPNLIHTFDVDSEADQFYLVMEHFPGEDLQTLIEKEGPLECRRAADIVRQAAEGLAHAAEKGLTHGDIRPSSIAVDESGRVKLLHLGVVELAGPSLNMLDENDPASADFAAPEFNGNNATAESDLYSLGCVFYCLLTGRPPFDEGSFEDRRSAHQSVPPASVTAKRPEAPADLAKICQKMLAKTPANRIGSAKEAAALLAAWLKKNPLPAPARPAAAKEEPLRKAEPLSPANALAAAAAAAASTPQESAAMPSFDFGAKKKTKAPAAKPAPAKQATAAEQATAPPQPAPKKAKGAASKKAVNKGLLIGLGVGGGVALLVIVGAAIAFFAMRGDKTEVAQAEAPPSQSPAAEGGAEGGAEEGMDEETLDGDLFSSSESNDETANEAGAADATQTVAAPASDDAAPPAESPAAAVSPPAEAPAATAVAAHAEAQPPAPAAEEPASDQAAPAEAAPALAASADPAAAEAPAEQVASAAPAENEKPKEAKAPPKNAAPPEPFANFKGEAISLPALEEGAENAEAPQAAALATVHDDPEAGCFVRLVGGDAAHKGREIFTLEPDDPGFRNRSWTIFSGVGELGDKDRVALAKLSLDEKDQLLFQWTPEAAQQDAANYLRNCVLSMNIGAKTKEVALRTPTQVEPLALSLEKAGGRGQYDLEFAPEPELLQIEITSLDGPFPKHNFVPGTSFKAAKGKTAILFGEPPNQVIMLEVRGDMSRKLSLTVLPYLNVNNRPARFTPSDLQRMALEVQAAYQQMNNIVTQKIGPEGQRKLIEQQLPQQQALAAQFTELAQNIDTWKEGGLIQFSLFFKVGERKVELIKSAGGAAGAPAGEAPADRKAARGERQKPAE